MSLRSKFTGTGIAIVTPFHQDGAVDWASYEKLIEFWITGGVEYLVVLGTTGESATVKGAEKQEVFSFVQKQVGGRVPLVAGIGGYDTREVIEDFRHFNLAGYDAILSVSPYYNKPNQQGIYQHYKALNEAAPLPIIMYNVPGRTGMNVTADTQLRIAHDCPHIFATKEASGNFDQFNQLLKYKPENFLVISGDDPITLPMIALGASGVISVVANAYPRGFSDMVRLCLKGEFEKARALHFRYTDIIATMFAEGSPSGVKAYLAEMGLCGYHFRAPVAGVSEGLRQRIRELMTQEG